LFSSVIFSQNTFSTEIGDNIHSQSPWSVVEVDDGYLISSDLNNATNFSVNLDIVLSKIDKQGNLLWEKIYEKDATSEFYPYLKKVENENKFILACSFGEKINDTLNVQFIIVKKIDGQGTIIWEQYLEGVHLRDFQITENGDIYVLMGNYYIQPNGFPYGNPLIYKLNSNGDIIWKKHYGNAYYELFKFIKIINNNIYIGGSIQGSFSGKGKYYKLDIDGNVIYEKVISSSVYSIFLDNENLFLLTRDEKIYKLEEENLELVNSDFNPISKFIRGFTITSNKEYVLAFN